MKKFLSVLLGAAVLGSLLAPNAVTAAGAEKTIKLLAIGNSFSEDALTYLREVSLAAGEDIAIHHLVIGGTSLEQHWTNAERQRSTYTFVKKHTESFSKGDQTMRYGLEYDRYDYVVLQQVSGLSGVPESYEPYLGNLIRLVREYQPTAHILFHQTWAYEKDSTHADFPRYGNDQTAMHYAIVNAAEQASVSHGLDLIPCGAAVKNARENARFDISKGGVSLCRDGYHMADAGRVLLALVWNSVLTGKRAADNPYVNDAVSAEDMELLKQAADEAVDLYHGKRIANAEFEGGERLDVLQGAAPNDARIKVTYLDGSSREVSLGAFPVDASEPGEHTVNYLYWDSTFTFTVNVVSRERVDALMEHIAAVVRFPDPDDIRSLRADYEALTDVEKAGVENYEDLVLLENTYSAEKEPPKEEPSSVPWQYFLLLLIPVAGAVVLTVILLKRKKKRK